MSIQLTPEQRAVVENEGGSLLVSAAAGSGKTRVLVERLFHRVLGEEGADLTDFLIITYTRAAAAELRERIAQELTDRLAADPGDRRLQRQLLLVYQADIKTVDAFCTALLRENVHLLDAEGERGLTADFRVLDEGEAMLLRRRVLPRVLEAFYARLTPGDALLADAFGFGRDDRGLEELVLELYRKVQSHPYPEKWLAEQAEVWSALPGDVGETPFGEELLAGLARKARHWAAMLAESRRRMAGDEALAGAYGPCFAQVQAQLERLAEAAGAGWDEAAGRRPLWPRLTAARKCGPELKDRMKSVWDRCKKEMTAACAMLDVSAAEAGEDLRRTAPAMKALLALCGDFSAAYRQEKLRRNAADFSDQEHGAVRLLLREDGGPTELARTVSDRYREVMVDEYQDTNQVQNCIFDAVSHGGRTLFTVGDAKQSIYRFRLADPSIFLDKYERWPDAAKAGKGEPRRLLLSRNFRSRESVLDAANFIFSNIMSRDMGELDYGEAEQLRFGADYLPARQDCETEFHLLDLSAEEEEDAPAVPQALAEARLAAWRIQALLTQGFPVTDAVTGQLRPCRPEDFAILMRSPGPRLKHYARALTERDIPCAAAEDEDFFSAMEVAVVLSLLEVLDNPRQDIPLIAVLRSPVFGFTPDQLALIRGQHPEGCFFDALEASEDPACRGFLARLEELRSLARDRNIHQLLWSLYDRLNILGVFGAMAGGEGRRENLIALTEHARTFESAGYKGLFSFVSHLRFLLENGEQPAAAAGAAAGGVRILSIHSAKGLEFPIVVLADLHKRFNTADLLTPVLGHPKLGLGPMYIDLDRRIRYPTAARDAVAARLSREARAEELRLLYVGMTRAKEKLILTASMPAAARRLGELTALADLPVPPETVDGARTMAEWVLLPLLRRPEAQVLRAAGGQEGAGCAALADMPWAVRLHDGSLFREAPGLRPATAEAGPATGPALPVNRAALDFSYPHALACATPTKVTATQLKGREKDREIAQDTRQPYTRGAFAAPRFLAGERALTPAERGTAAHLVLQHLPLDGDPAAVAADLVRRRLMTPEQAAAVDMACLRRFLASPLAEELRRAERLEREFRFSLLAPAADYFPGMAAEDEVLLQGVVDLYAVKDNTITVVDFKTDRVTPEEIARRAGDYRPQLEAYSAALECILGLPVVRRVLYFLRPGEAVEV